MWKPNLIGILLLSISAALLLGWLTTSSGIARNSQNPDQNLFLLDDDRSTPTLGNFPTITTTPTPDATNVIILPIVQQDASLQTSGELTPPPTITPTPVPPQSIEENAPIVFGAVVIVLIIILAWFVVGRKIIENRY
jgi:hypothetical protein